ncbi:MAG TPA: pilus assembly protein TadG-related protein [Pirellulales bacterium]|nr:pilus assembly protein TadG-related protein [Pirellulales bacterium]
MKTNQRQNRRGTVLVLLLLALIPLIACLALAIDLGMLAVAKTQTQDAADLAALAGVRALNGLTANSANNNYSAVVPTAQQAAANNKVLAAPIASSAVNIQVGRYVYNSANQRFEGQFPGPSTENWTLVQATVSPNVSSQMAFSKVLAGFVPQLQAVATAVHRPRDVAIILDFSGSMRFQSLSGEPYYGARQVNNADANVPVFGHYSATSSQLTASSFTWPYDQANITATTSDGRAPICADFYTDSSGTPAFTAQPAAYASIPGGDNCPKTNDNTGASYAHTAGEVVNIASPTNSSRDSTFESQGYAEFTTFHGYTQGPGYYGKTFFVWPPNPVSDWRKLYFTYPGSATAMDDNSKLWNGSGNWQAPGASTYAINYAAILNFITSSPNPFPARLQSGRILYYDQIPATIDLSSNPPTDLNQRFWKDYIDYVLGVIDDGAGNYTEYGNQGFLGYGGDDTWGTVKITAKSSLTGSPKPYMHYGDNPKRPRLRFWFGPLSMVDFLGNYNMWYEYTPYASRFCWWPGTCHEAPMYGCKLGIRAALSDIQSNHPNDFVSLIMFSVPQSSANDASGARFNRPRVGLGRNYSNMQDSLWYPPATVGNSGATVRPYDANNLEVPRSFGGTCYAMPLMLAYNQFSGASSLVNFNAGAPAGDAGGNGRKGAQKIVIFETDGAPNTTASATLANGGAYNSYYNVRYNSANPAGSQFPGGINGYGDNASTVTSQINTICQNIANLDSAGTPGYSTATKPVQIHCIGFGTYFSPSSPAASANISTLNAMQQIGNVNDGMPSYKLVYGDQNTIVANLQQAIIKILESTVPVALVR